MRKMKRKLVWMLCASLIFAQTGGPGLTVLSARAETAKKNGGGLPVASGSNGTETTGQATPSNAEKDGGGGFGTAESFGESTYGIGEYR